MGYKGVSEMMHPYFLYFLQSVYYIHINDSRYLYLIMLVFTSSNLLIGFI